MDWILLTLPKSSRGRCLLAQIPGRSTARNAGWGFGSIRGQVVVVVFATIDPDTIRINSLSKANKYERVHYEKAIADELGTG